MSATEQGVRAYIHAHGQIWDAYQGLTEAYQVDTGRSLNQPIPTWSSLTTEQQKAFTLAFRPVLEVLSGIASQVAKS